MNLKEFDVETWMTDHEGHCSYNMTDTCVAAMSLESLEALIGEDLTGDLRRILFDYGPINGSDRLKDEILKLYATGTQANLTITNGAVAGTHHVMDTLLEPGDHVVTLTPTYQQFYSYPESLGCTYDLVELHEENGWQPDMADFKRLIRDDTKAVFLNLPNNPTGSTLSEEQLRELIDICAAHDTWIVADEIYRGLNPQAPCISDIYAKGVSISSVSKLYGFAGLRLGWVKGPKELIDRIIFRRDYTMISTGTFDDTVARVVLEHKDALLKRAKDLVSANKDIVKAWLAREELVTCVLPEDGTVCFPHYHVDVPSAKLCEQLQEDTGVFFVPGSCFDCEHHLRLGLTAPAEELSEGLEIFADYLHRIKEDLEHE